MIAFGCAITNEEEYRAFAAPSVRRLAEPDSLTMRRYGYDSIYKPYNEMLDEASSRKDLEAVVLLHQDVSIDDEAFLSKIRALLAASREIALIGAIGGRDVSGLAWWEGEARGSINSPHMVPGGTFERYSRGAHEVESLDGLLLVFSAWAARRLRFDESLPGSLDGYDLDICFQAREMGGRVVVGDLEVSHYATQDFLDRERWVRAAVALRRKWSPDLLPTHL